MFQHDAFQNNAFLVGEDDLMLVFEQSCEAIKTYLAANLATWIDAVNAEVTDGHTVPHVRAFETDRFDIFTGGTEYPRCNIFPENRTIEPLTDHRDLFTETVVLIFGLNGLNTRLKADRLGEAVRRCFLYDATAGAAVEFITVVRTKGYLPTGDVTPFEVYLQILRQVDR